MPQGGRGAVCHGAGCIRSAGIVESAERGIRKRMRYDAVTCEGVAIENGELLP